MFTFWRPCLITLCTTILCTACLVDKSDDDDNANNESENQTRVASNTLTPKDLCLGVECESSGGGGGSSSGDDPPTDDGGKGYPYPEPPIDSVKDWKADLVPVKTLGTYCARDKAGDLVININNAGMIAAPETTTRITFAMIGDTTVSTSALAVGETAQHRIQIPPDCFRANGGNCSFAINADAFFDVGEASESNNNVWATCPGF